MVHFTNKDRTVSEWCMALFSESLFLLLPLLISRSKIFNFFRGRDITGDLIAKLSPYFKVILALNITEKYP